MQGTKIRLLTGGLLMMATVVMCRQKALQPDPAWQQGTLANGFQWQVLATPQRPSDRIEVRLSVNIGSLSESTQQSGFSHFIPRLALNAKRWPPDHAGPFAMASRVLTRSVLCRPPSSLMTTVCLT
ncbi:protein YhjJ [Klebsiella michiganensis]|uniref:Protein YhjJ n=1 Tax=Klebsiella michiganensis TaxID=1134687 RepID=A0A7H4PFV8_9ENTR|nr:protein YhjJ [Klebsiella michiganensis]